MTDCCIPQQNPALYPFTHRLIHNYSKILMRSCELKEKINYTSGKYSSPQSSP